MERAKVAAAKIVGLLPGMAERAVAFALVKAVRKDERELSGRPFERAAAVTSFGMLVASLLFN